jgi:hypothetical protein
MKKEEINEMAMDLIKVNPEYTYRLWDSENKRILIATGANLAEYPEEVAILCVEENQQICLSSSELMQPESKIYFQSKIKKAFNAKEALDVMNKHIEDLKELIRQMEMFEQLKELNL